MTDIHSQILAEIEELKRRRSRHLTKTGAALVTTAVLFGGAVLAFFLDKV